MTPPSAIKALRESFGDRKLPEISRKITSCVACRKAKTKCYMNNSSPPCSRCKDRGLSCTMNKSIQMLLENDAKWKELIEQRLMKLEKSTNTSGKDDRISSSDSAASSAHSESLRPTRALETPLREIFTNAYTNDVVNTTLNLSCSLGAFPASSLQGRALERQNKRPDLISNGVISVKSGERFLRFYQSNMNPFIHHIISDIETLPQIRQRSPALTAAICAVAALCTDPPSYQDCLQAFLKEVSLGLFSTTHDFDDVRALCIGAFWIKDKSHALIALAVRLAGDLSLHRCITKIPHVLKECFERTRLYFIVYVVDRHCSLSHGRPPLTRDMACLNSPRTFLQSEFSIAEDFNLVNQLELWSISSGVFDKFGADIESSFSAAKSVELKRSINAFDAWYRSWIEIMSLRPAADEITSHMLSLYYFSAKLYLYSHIFRGPTQRSPNPLFITNGMDSDAGDAIKQATSIASAISDGLQKDPRLCPIHLPVYFSTVIAFASVLLLRSSEQPQLESYVKKDKVHHALSILAESIDVFGSCTENLHPLHGIANSLGNAMRGRGEAISLGDVGLNPLDNGQDQLIDYTAINFDFFGQDLFGLSFADDNTIWPALADHAEFPLPANVAL